jgi:hypothetical protein
VPDSKAGLVQVAKTILFGLLMIGKKRTWEEGGDGARMSATQVVVGALVGGAIVIAALIALVRLVLA